MKPKVKRKLKMADSKSQNKTKRKYKKPNNSNSKNSYKILEPASHNQNYNAYKKQLLGKPLPNRFMRLLIKKKIFGED